MKTEKKTTARSTKTTGTKGKSLTSPMVKISENVNKNDMATQEDIRELAEIIYHQRIARGEQRTAEEDWLEAESYLKDQK